MFAGALACALAFRAKRTRDFTTNDSRQWTKIVTIYKSLKNQDAGNLMIFHFADFMTQE